MSQSITSKVKSFFKSVVMKPSPAAVFQAVKAVRPHTRMIKFRYGGAAGHSMAASPPPASTPQHAAPPTARASVPPSQMKPNATIALPVIEDWQLPAKYRRRPLDPAEIDYINRGGPE